MSSSSLTPKTLRTPKTPLPTPSPKHRRSNYFDDPIKAREASLRRQDFTSTLSSKPRSEQVETLKDRAATIADLTSQDIIRRAKASGKKNTIDLQRQTIVFGTAFDKVALGNESEALSLKIPASMLTKLHVQLGIEAPVENKTNADNSTISSVSEGFSITESAKSLKDHE